MFHTCLISETHRHFEYLLIYIPISAFISFLFYASFFNFCKRDLSEWNEKLSNNGQEKTKGQRLNRPHHRADSTNQSGCKNLTTQHHKLKIYKSWPPEVPSFPNTVWFQVSGLGLGLKCGCLVGFCLG